MLFAGRNKLFRECDSYCIKFIHNEPYDQFYSSQIFLTKLVNIYKIRKALIFETQRITLKNFHIKMPFDSIISFASLNSLEALKKKNNHKLLIKIWHYNIFFHSEQLTYK